MSHLHERKEKNCLNCGTILTGRYCQNCGQENLEPKESVWHLIVHFFNDVTHFDGKLFSTLRYLLTKPGFLTEEYVRGRRASYLNPIRMYLFISAVFFLILMSFFLPETSTKTSSKYTAAQRDSIRLAKRAKIESSVESMLDIDSLQKDTVTYSKEELSLIVLSNHDTFTKKQIESYQPKTIAAYDSFQNLLPKKERQTGFQRYITRKMAGATDYSNKHDKESSHKLFANFFHSVPYMLFFSLPIITLLFKLIYIRRKEYYYVSHGIFIIHFFCVVFIDILLMLILGKMGSWADIPQSILFIGLFVYLYIAMLRFYKQGWFKTLIKFFIINFFSFIFLSILSLIMFFNSYLNLS